MSREAADGQSFIRLSKVVFERPAAVARRYRALDGETGFVDALVFEVGDRELVGHVEEDGSHRFCCTPQLAAKIRCTPGHVIVKVRHGHPPSPSLAVYFTIACTCRPA